MRQTLAVLLMDPYAPCAMRQAVRVDAFEPRVYAQAALRPKDGGVGCTPAERLADACFVAQGVALLSLLFQHSAALHLPADLSAAQALPWGQQLAAAASRLPALRSREGACTPRTLDGLLSGTPTSRSQHRLTGDVYVELLEDVRALQPDAQHRARLASTGGAYAGAWLGVLPLNDGSTALPHEYRIALCLRLGAPLAELTHGELRCPSCGLVLDVYGFHPGTCKKGNVDYAWTQRSERLEGALAFVARRMGVHAVVVGSSNWFGMAGWDPRARNGKGAFRRADVVFPGFNGGGQRHLYADVAITDGANAAAVASNGGNVTVVGVAAANREAAKVRKYKPICDRLGATFKPGVIERGAHCGDGMCSIIKLLTGDL